MTEHIEYKIKVKKIRLWKLFIALYSVVIAMIIGGYIETITRNLTFPFATIASYSGFGGSVIGSILLYEYSKSRLIKKIETSVVLN
ncbi:MAG: hypothetical protein AAB922_00600 [Patescibacteria group bacterium]